MGVSTLISEEEYLNLPEFTGKQELLDGELIELPPAKYSHHELSRRIAELMETAVDQARVWVEMGYRLEAQRWLIPDVSVFWPEQRVEKDYPQGAPMLAIEIASRGNTPEELERKRTLYLEHGAAEVWIIYPKTRTMLVSRRDGTTLVEAGAGYRCELMGITVTPDYRTPVS